MLRPVFVFRVVCNPIMARYGFVEFKKNQQGGQDILRNQTAIHGREANNRTSFVFFGSYLKGTQSDRDRLPGYVA